MANEQQYYAPIIQAMIASYQKQQQAAELEQRRQESKAQIEHQKAQEAAAERQLDIHQKQIDFEHEHFKGSLENEAKHIQLMADQAKLNAYKTSNEMGAAGVNLNKLAPQLSGMLGGGQGQPPVDFSAFPTAEQTSQIIAGRAGGIAGAEANAQLPSKQALADFEGNIRSRLTDKEIASKEKMAGWERGTQLAMNNATNNTHLQIAGMQFQPSPDTTRSLQVGFATGQLKPNPANPIERAAYASNQQMGFRDFDQKDAEALRQSQALLPLFDKLRAFADKLPSTQAGAFVQGHALGAAAGVGWPTDTQREINNINSQAIQVGRTVEGLTGGRISNKQLELDLGALASGGITKQQAISSIDNLHDLYTNKQENMLLGGMPDAQKDLIYKTYGIKPAWQVGPKPQWLKLAPQKNSAGHQLDEENSRRLGQPVYSPQQ